MKGPRVRWIRRTVRGSEAGVHFVEHLLGALHGVGPVSLLRFGIGHQRKINRIRKCSGADATGTGERGGGNGVSRIENLLWTRAWASAPTTRHRPRRSSGTGPRCRCRRGRREPTGDACGRSHRTSPVAGPTHKTRRQYNCLYEN